MTNKTVYLDTNVFIYWLDSASEFQSSAVRVLEQIIKGQEQGLTSTLTLTELVAGFGREGGQALGKIKMLVNLSSLDEAAAMRAGELRRKYPTLKTPDAIHLATALSAKSQKFITADKRLHAVASKELRSVLLK